MSENKNPGTMSLIVPTGKEIVKDLTRNRRAILLALLFFLIYILLSSILIFICEKAWSYWYSIYFTIINTASGGFGDVVPASFCGEILVCINSIVGLVFFGILVALITLAFQPNSNSYPSKSTPELNDSPTSTHDSVERDSKSFGQLFNDFNELEKILSDYCKNGEKNIEWSGSNDISITWHKHRNGEKHITIQISLREE